MSWSDHELMKLAYKVATLSPDPRTQCGSVLYQPETDEVIATGCNDFPEGINSFPERLEPPWKYLYLEHTERNSLVRAIRSGKKIEGSRIYLPWLSCADCTRMLVALGVKEIVGDNNNKTPHGKWIDSIFAAQMMQKEKGIAVRFIDGPFGYTIRLNGELIQV